MPTTPQAAPAHRFFARVVPRMLAALAACVTPEQELEEPTSDRPTPESSSPADTDTAAANVPTVARADATERAEPRQPSGWRIAKPALVVYADRQQRRAARRGQLESRRPFAIYGVEPGPGCEGEGWAEVDQDGFVCLEHATVSEGPAQIQPELPEGQSLPFIYARPKILDRKSGRIAHVPRWRDRYALTRGDPPIDVLGPDRQYTFTKTKTRKAGLMLIDADERAVLARDLKIADPSTFSGRELAAQPVPPDRRAAWSVGHPAILRERPAADAPQVRVVEYHATLDIDPQPIAVGDQQWFAVPDANAFVVAADMNYWIPGPELAEVAGDELWLDVELGQQTLAIMRGQSPEFVTLISSGAGGTSTPPGLFRIYEKLAVSTMRSGPNAEDPYYVEGVPWVQYFHRRYALHASYWHDDFGKRRSHGCVNLSPKDAARVYALTSPNVPPGWNSLIEHKGDPGTLVRVRRGTEPVTDRRLPLGEVDATEDTEG